MGKFHMTEQDLNDAIETIEIIKERRRTYPEIAIFAKMLVHLNARATAIYREIYPDMFSSFASREVKTV